MTWLTCLLVGAALLTACGTAPGPVDPEPVPEPDPEVAPGRPLLLSNQGESASFELENISDDTLDWTIEVTNAPSNPQPGDWFAVSPDDGRLGPFGRQVVTLTQRSGLEPGRYSSILRVVYGGGVTAFDVIGEVIPDGSQEGAGSIEGFLRTDNALIPLQPRASFQRSSIGADAEPEERQAYLPGQLVVGLEPSARLLSAEGEDPLVALAERTGAEVVSEDPESGTALLRTSGDPAEVARRLQADPAVAFAEPNYLFYLHALPNDPLLEDAWQLPVVGAPVAWTAPDGGSGPVVAVIDSGIDVDHEDLRGIFISGGRDFCANFDCTATDADPRPDSSADTHGTHVTGLLSAIAGNGRGSAGVAAGAARIVPIKVFDGGFTTASALADAIRWAAGLRVDGVPTNQHPADIITLSLGSGEDSQLVRNAVEAAVDEGALVIASAGNQGHGSIDYPARYADVVAVGSVNSEFERSCFSDYGSGLDIVAPGGDGFLPIGGCSGADDEALLSTFPGNDYGLDAGTSMAAPIVAGTAALVWTHTPDPSAEVVRDRLEDTAYFDDSYMTREFYGAGVVRADLALGLPGPGDEATVQATGPSTALDTVTLLLDGTSTGFSLDGLASGSYTVAADALGDRFTLSGASSFSLSPAGDLNGVAVPLGR